MVCVALVSFVPRATPLAAGTSKRGDDPDDRDHHEQLEQAKTAMSRTNHGANRLVPVTRNL